MLARRDAFVGRIAQNIEENRQVRLALAWSVADTEGANAVDGGYEQPLRREYRCQEAENTAVERQRRIWREHQRVRRVRLPAAADAAAAEVATTPATASSGSSHA